MASRFDTVDEYIDALPAHVQPIMERIRATIRDVVPGVGEKISYSMPTFTLDGLPLVHVAAWRKHIGLYPLPPLDGVAVIAVTDAPAAAASGPVVVGSCRSAEPGA